MYVLDFESTKLYIRYICHCNFYYLLGHKIPQVVAHSYYNTCLQYVPPHLSESNILDFVKTVYYWPMRPYTLLTFSGLIAA